MELTSRAFEEGELIPSQFTCDGENTNPPLSFEEVPADTVTLALIMDDHDVPTDLQEDGIWDHWVIWNIDPMTITVDEGEEPDGVSGTTSSNTLEYIGPCPPDQEHRYVFKLYALDTEIDLPEGSTKRDLELAIEEHIIDEAELMGRYERQ